MSERKAGSSPPGTCGKPSLDKKQRKQEQESKAALRGFIRFLFSAL